MSENLKQFFNLLANNPEIKEKALACNELGKEKGLLALIELAKEQGMELSEAENFVNDFIDNIGSASDLKNTVVIDKLIMKSCKSAVKAHDHLSKEEIDALIKDLKNCVNPFSCPHGRPTFIKLSNYEIERLFKRA